MKSRSNFYPQTFIQSFSQHRPAILRLKNADLIRDLHHQYDNRGNVKERRDSLSGVTDTFSHDLHDRLTDWQRQDSAGNSFQRSYDYDKRGNMTKSVGDIGNGGGRMVYDKANRLLRRNDGGFHY